MKEAIRMSIGDALTRREAFDSVIDVRSPGEFAEDHLPGAVNLPVLDDQERIMVGTLHATSPFEARRLGAALVSTRIGAILSGPLADKPRDWRALVYCWRGGNRSSSLSTVMARVGWPVTVLEGGYRAWRRHVLESLPDLVKPLRFRVVAGRTGTGKSRLLHALARSGAQVLDLEAIANHRGSVLGLIPQASQPSQKRFDSLLWDALARLRTDAPVWVEAESRKIGALQVPQPLIEAMRASEAYLVEMPIEMRAALLLKDYAHFRSDPADLLSRLERLRSLVGGERLLQWRSDINAGHWEAFVVDLLRNHYDPAYDRSMMRNFNALANARRIEIAPDAALPSDPATAIDTAASRILTADRPQAGGLS